MIRKYELTLLLDATTSEAELKNIDKMLKKWDKGAKLDETEIKLLAYPIGNHEKGRFVYYKLELNNEQSFGLGKELQNNEQFLRYMMVAIK